MSSGDRGPDAPVREEDLDFAPFHCCGDEDLYPFRCPGCGKIMVLCYECDTLYEDLDPPGRRCRGIPGFGPSEPAFSCPGCGRPVEDGFMDDEKGEAYRVTRSEWLRAGLGRLLLR